MCEWQNGVTSFAIGMTYNSPPRRLTFQSESKSETVRAQKETVLIFCQAHDALTNSHTDKVLLLNSLNYIKQLYEQTLKVRSDAEHTTLDKHPF